MVEKLTFVSLDIVLWDSHPLALGATPQQVWIDGIAQIAKPHVHVKPSWLQQPPKTPNFDKEASLALEYDGLPPLLPEHSKSKTVVFTNVSEVLVKEGYDIQELSISQSTGEGVVVVENGHISCAGSDVACASAMHQSDAQHINLMGGSISPGLLSFGSPLGLQEIQGEASTSDGYVFDPLVHEVPGILGGEGAVIHAADGLQFATRDAL